MRQPAPVELREPTARELTKIIGYVLERRQLALVQQGALVAEIYRLQDELRRRDGLLDSIHVLTQAGG